MMKKDDPLPRFFIRLLCGAVIGLSAILPGVSGGVFAVTFGVYRPLMALIASPFRALHKVFALLLPIAIGWVLGFAGGALVIADLLARSEKAAVCLCIGMILGSLPKLWKETGREGHGKKACISMCAAFALMFAVLVCVQVCPMPRLSPGIPAFLLCGVLWGISLIVPGMTSASTLVALGLFTPLTAGIASLDLSVILPWLIGLLAFALPCAKGVSRLFDTHYALLAHAVFGVVFASSLSILPLSYDSPVQLLTCLSLLLGGAAAVIFLDRKMGT